MQQILGILSFLSDLAPLVLLLVFRGLLKEVIYKILLAWCIASVSLDLIIAFSSKDAQQFYAMLSVFLEPPFVFAIYYFSFNESKKAQNIMLILTTCYLIPIVGLSIFTDISNFNNLIATITLFLVLAISCVQFYIAFRYTKDQLMFDSPIVFFIIGYIIYTSDNFFLFSFTEEFPNIFEQAGLWQIFIVANILKNTMIVLMLLKAKSIILDKKTN